VPLTEIVSFKIRLQMGNRIQLPKLVWWKYKIEPDQVLKVTVTAADIFCGYETFYARMDKSGRITITELTLKLLQDKTREKQSLTGAVMEIRLEPA